MEEFYVKRKRALCERVSFWGGARRAAAQVEIERLKVVRTGSLERNPSAELRTLARQVVKSSWSDSSSFPGFNGPGREAVRNVICGDYVFVTASLLIVSERMRSF